MNHWVLLLPPAIYASAFLGAWSALGLRRLLIRHRLLKLLNVCRCTHAEGHHFLAIGCTGPGCLCPFFQRPKHKLLAVLTNH